MINKLGKNVLIKLHWWNQCNELRNLPLGKKNDLFCLFCFAVCVCLVVCLFVFFFSLSFSLFIRVSTSYLDRSTTEVTVIVFKHSFYSEMDLPFSSC